MRKVGIWIDKRTAKVITIEGENVNLETITSDVEDYNPSGGSGTRTKGGPQDVVKEKAYLEREKRQLTTFFKAIIPHLTNAEAIVIFGPAQTGQKLYTELSEKHTALFKRTKPVEKADSMSDNQMIAWVRDYNLANS